jgi:hypothetical protein
MASKVGHLDVVRLLIERKPEFYSPTPQLRISTEDDDRRVKKNFNLKALRIREWQGPESNGVFRDLQLFAKLMALPIIL